MKEQTENHSRVLCVVWMMFCLILVGIGKLEISHMQQCRPGQKKLGFGPIQSDY